MTNTIIRRTNLQGPDTLYHSRHEVDRLRAELAQSREALDRTERALDDERAQIARLQAESKVLRDRDNASQTDMRRMDEELRLAARLQHDFLPKKLPSVEPVRFATLFRPANWVSGDLFDVFRLDEDHVGFYVADAVGHGVPAALLTMFMKNALKTKEINGSTYRLLGPDETLRRLNLSLVTQNLAHATFATALYGTLNVRTLQMTVAKAGHPSPVLLRDGQPPAMLESDGGLLGIFADETFEPQTVQLQRGDRVLFYTDGVEVGFSPEPDAGIWMRILADMSARAVEGMIDHFRILAESQPGSLHPKDDLTIVAMQID